MAIYNIGMNDGILDPTTKTSGQILTYNNGVWVAQNQIITSVNGKTGAVSLTASDVGAAAATHASRHKTGGADPLTPANIGAMTTAYHGTAATRNTTNTVSTNWTCGFYQMGQICLVRLRFKTSGSVTGDWTSYDIASGLPEPRGGSTWFQVVSRDASKMCSLQIYQGKIILHVRHYQVYNTEFGMLGLYYAISD